jgi:hypothetical protein
MILLPTPNQHSDAISPVPPASNQTYLAFRSDYLTHIKDIPPQYDPGCGEGFEADQDKFSSSILGIDGSWHLPLPHDDPVQPLYRSVPLPICVLEAAGVTAEADGSYMSYYETAMEEAYRFMATWKLSGNGAYVAEFSARGGPAGSKNPQHERNPCIGQCFP